MKLIFWIWGLPQNLVGLIMHLYFRKKSKVYNYKGACVTVTQIQGVGAVSLGEYIFFLHTYVNDGLILRHEYGHTMQSRILGPLYLLVIGLPSILWAGLFKGYRKRNRISYFNFYTERWANRLGGIFNDDFRPND